jgi:hypothetical protein
MNLFAPKYNISTKGNAYIEKNIAQNLNGSIALQRERDALKLQPNKGECYGNRPDLWHDRRRFVCTAY